MLHLHSADWNLIGITWAWRFGDGAAPKACLAAAALVMVGACAGWRPSVRQWKKLGNLFRHAWQ